MAKLIGMGRLFDHNTGDQVAFGAIGAIAGSSVNGLMAVHELLRLGNERRVNAAVVKLVKAIADQHREDAV